MSYTVNDLAVSVLRKLRVIDATENSANVEAEILAQVTSIYQVKWDEITAHGMELTYWPYDAIPAPVFLTMRDLLALELQGDFGQPISAADKEAEETIILRRLRRHTQVQASGKPVEALYY